MKRRDLSDLVNVLVKYDNEGWDEFSELTSKWLRFGRHKDFNSPLHLKEDTSISMTYDEMGRYSKITFLRKVRDTTESAWKEYMLEVVPDPKFNGRFAMKSFHDTKEYEPYRHEYMDDSTFFGTFMKKLKTFFFVEEEWSPF